MKGNDELKKILLALLMMTAVSASADNIRLPVPEKTGGMSLREALTLRRTAREFSDKDFNVQELSNMLYAAGGINRTDGKLVYPVGMGVQDTKIYAVMKDGIYEYDAQLHSLEQLEYGDHRAECSNEEFAGKAGINLVYVQDLDAWKDVNVPKEVARMTGMYHSGAIMQNVYLYAASENLNCVVQGTFNNAKLRELLRLNDNQNITLIQSIGFKPSN